MKYRGIGTLPSSVARWLEEQLEEKGIDRVLYSRYFQHLIERNDEKLDNPVFYKDSNLGGLVDEFWTKLKEANKDGNCLKEKTNLRDIYNLEVLNSVPNLSNKYYSAFPVGSKEFENYCEKSLWTRNLKRLGKKELELSPKIFNQENKENVYGLNRMRSRSTVKQSGGSLKTRSSAKSLDRNDEAVVRYVKSEMKGRKCLNFYSDEMEGSAAKISRTPGRRERNDLSECDQDLPMDFQQLLQSPDDSCFYKHPKQTHPPPNFIQSGTNLTNSIWSERMEEDELPVWEKNKWSEARSSILSSAWKWPFDEKEESADHSLADDSSFFSFFSVNKPPKEDSFLNHPQSDVKIIAPKVREIKQEKLPTTTRTHFKPIKDDPEYEPSSHNYIDGSTFLISTTFVQIEYQRSESGGYFLGADEYEEFKRTDVEQSEGCFKPKFKLLRNEKMVQTDEEYVDELQFLENEPSEPSSFFFPGDDQLAEDMVNSGEEDDQPMIQVNGWITTWPVSDSDAIWSNKGTDEAFTPWIYGFGGSKIENFEVDKNDDHHARLRNELTEDGEELLSDLSSIHLFLNPERMDDSNAIIQANFSPKMCTPMCPMKKGSISNELIF